MFIQGSLKHVSKNCPYAAEHAVSQKGESIMELNQSDMTLEEWVDQLPADHQARKQYAGLMKLLKDVDNALENQKPNDEESNL